MQERVHLILKILNAPITIWLLSAVVIGLFGAMYDDVRRCRAESQSAATSYHRLGAEIANRRSALHRAIKSASSISDLRNADIIRDNSARYTFLEFKERHLAELEHEYVQVGRKLLRFPDIVMALTRERFKRANALWDASGKPERPSPLIEIDLDRLELTKLTDDDLPALRKMVKESEQTIQSAYLETLGNYVVPNCGYHTAFLRVLTGYPEHIATLESWKSLSKR